MTRRDERRAAAMERAAIRRGRRIERVLRRDGKIDEANKVDAILDSDDGALMFSTGIIEMFHSQEQASALGDGELFRAFLEWLQQVDWDKVMELIAFIFELISGLL